MGLSEKEVTEKQIQDKLNEILTDEFQNKTIKLFAKLIFNLRFDLEELKIELYKALTGEDTGEVNHKKEEEDGRFYT